MDKGVATQKVFSRASNFTWYRAKIKGLFFQITLNSTMAENKENQIVLSCNNPQSPYYLDSSNNPGNVISPVTLNEVNYENLSRLVSPQIQKKKKNSDLWMEL